jgi:hypothetical protein
MPLIYYRCECSHSVSKFFRQAKDAPAFFACEAPECKKQAKKQLKAPSSTSKIVVDNGFQARAVEVNPDIIEINEARSNKDYRED